MGIEPTLVAWEATVLPLNYARLGREILGLLPPHRQLPATATRPESLAGAHRAAPIRPNGRWIHDSGAEAILKSFMSPAPRLRPVRRIRVYCPIGPSTVVGIASGDAKALGTDPVARPLLDFIEACPECGDFGFYRGVAEVSIGVEAFTPTAGATPTAGTVGERSYSATAAITTYVDADLAQERLSEILDSLAERHPWEVPVIEVTVADLRIA